MRCVFASSLLWPFSAHSHHISGFRLFTLSDSGPSIHIFRTVFPITTPIALFDASCSPPIPYARPSCFWCGFLVCLPSCLPISITLSYVRYILKHSTTLMRLPWVLGSAPGSLWYRSLLSVFRAFLAAGGRAARIGLEFPAQAAGRQHVASYSTMPAPISLYPSNRQNYYANLMRNLLKGLSPRPRPVSPSNVTGPRLRQNLTRPSHCSAFLSVFNAEFLLAAETPFRQMGARWRLTSNP